MLLFLWGAKAQEAD